MKKVVVFIFLLLVFSRTAECYTRITTFAGQNPKWAAMPVPYWINDKGSRNIFNGSEFAAVRASFQTWQNIQTAQIQFADQGTTSIGTVGHDGLNVVTFSDNSAPLGSSTIAATFSFFKNQGGELVFEESDIAFNTALDFSTSGESNKFDIQSVLTHEIGHLLGLDHSALVSSVMVPFGVMSQLDQRTLAYDDIAGVMEIYPNTSNLTATGQIRGRIQSGTTPVLGAHVIAIDSTGTAVTSTLSRRDGSYTLRFLVPGIYRVVAEPLDGPVTVQNIGGANGFYSATNSNFGTTYFGNVSSLSEATPLDVGTNNVAIADIQLLPASATGLNLTRPGFGLRIPRGRTTTLTGAIGGVDISDGVVFAASDPGLQFGPFTFGGRVSTTAPSSASVQLTVLASTPLGPKILAVNRGTDASIVPGAFVVTDPVPTATSVTPTLVSMDGDTVVAVTGSNFRPNAQVYFAGLAGLDVQVINSSTISARTPANTPGFANVVVVNADGTWAVGHQIFTYVAQPPAIRSVSPLSGPPGTEVVIQGDHFDSLMQNIDVQFNGSSARLISASTNAIRAIVPFDATTGPITVSVFGQTARGPVFGVTALARTTNFASQTFQFIDASVANGGTPLGFNSNDDAIAPFNLPFDFILFRDIYLTGSRISIGVNGYLSLDSLSTDEFQNAPLPSKTVSRIGIATGTIGNVPPSQIAPFWDDLFMHSDSAITTKVIGTAPNRQFVVEWANLSILDEYGDDLNASVTFEAVLYEGSNDIQFLYLDMKGPRSDGSSATIGAQNAKRDQASQAGFNQPIASGGYWLTYYFKNGTYSNSQTEATQPTPAEVKIIPAAPQNQNAFTGISLLAPVTMSVTLNALNNNGNLITGAGVRNPVTVTLVSGQQYSKLISELFGLQSFDGWIEADASATGLGIFVATGSWDLQHLDGVVPRDVSRDFILFHSGSSAILVNPSSSAANVTLTEFRSRISRSLTIPARARVITALSDITRVQSSEPLSAVERSTVSGSLASNEGIPVLQVQPGLVFPGAVVGGGYSSVLTVVNTADVPQSLTVTFESSSASLQVDSNAALRISIGDLLQLSEGPVKSAAVRVTVNLPFGTTPSPGSLVGVLDIQRQGDNVTISSRPAGTDFTIANISNGDGFFTGLAFATGNVAAKIAIEVYSSTGGAPVSGTMNLDANQELGRLLSDLVPASAGQAGGYIHIRSDQPIWAWEIFGSLRAMASGPPL